MRRAVSLCSVLMLATLPLTGWARPGGGDDGQGRRPPPPPQEALDACDGQAENATCSFTLEGETRAGVCMPGPSPELPLACRPEGHEGNRGERSRE